MSAGQPRRRHPAPPPAATPCSRPRSRADFGRTPGNKATAGAHPGFHRLESCQRERGSPRTD